MLDASFPEPCISATITRSSQSTACWNASTVAVEESPPVQVLPLTVCGYTFHESIWIPVTPRCGLPWLPLPEMMPAADVPWFQQLSSGLPFRQLGSPDVQSR